MAIRSKRHVNISSRVFFTLWWLLLFLQVFNAVFLISISHCYYTFNTPTSFLSFVAFTFLFFESQKFLSLHYWSISVAYGCLAVPFVYGAVTMMWSSLKRGELAFGFGKQVQDQTRKNQRSTRTETQSPTNSQWLQLRRLLLSFDIKGARFMWFIIAVESAEIGLQTVQGYQWSKYINNLHVNQVYGLMIFCNCCSTPLIHYYWEHRRCQVLMARLWHVLIDAVLDFLWGTALQAVLLSKYWKFYNDQKWSHDVPENYDRELRQILVVSSYNFVLSAFPFVTTFIVTSQVSLILENARTRTSRVGTRARVLSVTAPPQANNTPHGPTIDTLPNAKPARPLTRALTHRSSKLNALSSYYSNTFFALSLFHGVLVLVTSIASTGTLWMADSSGIECKDRVYPWFTSTVTCVGRQVNCTLLDGAEDKEVVAAQLHDVNPHLLANLQFVDCPALRMPATIQNFQDLVTLRVFNTTIVEWGSEAAVSLPFFPELKTLALHNTTLLEQPHGLTGQRLPVEWIYFKNVNTDWFADVSDGAWNSTVYFYCVGCGLRELPLVLNSMVNLQELALSDNLIESIPINALEPFQKLAFVRLRNNPLNDSFAGVWSILAQFKVVDVQSTKLTDLPASATSSVPDLQVQAFVSPLCDQADLWTIDRPAWLTCTDVGEGW